VTLPTSPSPARSTSSASLDQHSHKITGLCNGPGLPAESAAAAEISLPNSEFNAALHQFAIDGNGFRRPVE
ncbi:hypothetical protein, partial [Kitasatospora phosalacinea]|uniref:hypothetical protein n=1 Tax=Kitasatospora phosalacinea TaxID=2065 RepID=UPI001ADECCB3